MQEASNHARQHLVALEALARQSDELAEMDFGFLFDPARELFAIGFNVTDRRRDTSYYDLLASEARLFSYVMIAQGQVPQDHWFSLSRLLVAAQGEPILVSWSGSMFEYLMPLLVMPNYENTLLAHTCQAAVRQQIKYGKTRHIPWGISESSYNRTDIHLNYQYRAFGVPGLGLKRGLADDLVIAPYATAMALMVSPRAACENLQRLAVDGRAGDYGFYEAVDYTASRLPPDETSVTIRSFMAHHQGMSLLALLYLLRDRPMQRRFLASPLLKAADLLLAGACAHGHGERVFRRFGTGGIHETLQRRPGCHADADQSRRVDARGPSPFQRPLSCRHQQRRRRLQSLARPGAHPLARGRHARLLGNICLFARRPDRRLLVRRPSAHAVRHETLRGHLHARARRIPRPSYRTRNPHRN